MDAPVATGSRVTITDDSLYNAFPGFCVAANDDLLATYSAGSSHDHPDQVVKLKRSTDDGATWSAATTVSGTHTYSLKNACLQKLSDDSIVMTYYELSAAASTQRCWSRRSTDNGATWSSPARIPTLGTYWTGDGNMGGALSSPVVEDPSTPGTLRIAMFAINSGQDPTYCWVHTSKSTDYGLTWATDATVFAYNGSTDGFEPNLLWVRKADGSRELQCYIRRNSSGSVLRSISSDGGTTWGAVTTVASGMGGPTQPQVFQLPDDGIVLQVRDPLGSSPSAYAHGFRFSSNYGASFGSTQVIDATGGDVYGQWALITPTLLGHVYALDKGPTTPYPNVANTNADVYFQAFTVHPSLVAEGYGNTVSAGYGSATAEAAQGSILVLPESAAWEQVDTSIFVRTVNEPSTVEATITGTAGGLLRFRGADADRFDASLDGTTWASSVDIPAGTSTVHLRVTPEAPGTTLSAEIGVPV